MATRRPLVQLGTARSMLPIGDTLPRDAIPNQVLTHQVTDKAAATVALVPGFNVIEVSFDGPGTVTVTASAGVNAMYETVRVGGAAGTVTTVQG